MNLHTDDDMDDALRAWADTARRGASEAAPPSIADLLAERRRHRTLGAVAASVVLVVALAVGLGFGLKPEQRIGSAAPQTTQESTVKHGPLIRGSCATRFTDAGTVVNAAKTAALVVLRYTGADACAIPERPQIALVDSQGKVTGPHAPSVTFNPTISVRPGDTVRFTVTLSVCSNMPYGTFSLLVSLRPTEHPSPATGIELASARVHVEPSGYQCIAAQAGAATPIRIVSAPRESTLAHLTRIARGEAAADGDRTASAEAVHTTYGPVESRILDSSEAGSAANRVWVVQLRGTFTCGSCRIPLGASTPRGDTVVVVLQEPGLRLSDTDVGNRHYDLAKLGTVVPLIP